MESIYYVRKGGEERNLWRQQIGLNLQITRALKKSYQVWAFGKLLVLASIWCIVNSRGPAAPENPEKSSTAAVLQDMKCLCCSAASK